VTTAGNVRWFCPANSAIVVRIPVGYTTLHYEGLVNSSVLYLIELEQ
jgi:hypothetical protein